MSKPLLSNDLSCVAKIAGNASDDTKRTIQSLRVKYGNSFGDSIHNRMKIVEISLNKNAEEEKRMQVRLVIELDVTEDMLNGAGSIHGGCSAFLVDMCSSLALVALTLETSPAPNPTVSQSLSIVYHSPAQLTDKLRIVNTTLTAGARAHSARTEIWNVTHHRLVVSGTHIKMVPSLPKAAL